MRHSLLNPPNPISVAHLSPHRLTWWELQELAQELSTPPMEALLWINDWMPWHRADGLLQRALFLQAEPCNLMPA